LVKVEGTLEELRALFLEGMKSEAKKKSKSAGRKVVRKGSRKVSEYSKRVGRHLKALKRKHPRTNVTKLMKKAHRLAKRK